MNDSSHRDSPLGCYVGPVREVFSGDPRLGMAYIPMGRKLLGYLKNTLGAGGIEVGTQRLALPDGARLAAHVDGVNHILHIDVRDVVSGFEKELAIFVETGWIPLENLSGGEAPLTFSPLYYGARQYAALALDFPQWLDEIILTLNEDGIVTHQRAGLVRSPHAPTLPNYPPESLIDSIGFQTFERYDAEGRPDFVYTRTPACVPNPGYATGKLKLYLQALLGKIGNKKFVLDDPEKTDPWSEKISTVVKTIMGDYWAWVNAGLAFSVDYSRGLYTTPDYQYWLLTISGQALYAQRIILPYRHAVFRRTRLKDLRDPAKTVLEKEKIETYILSGGVEFGPMITVHENLLTDVVGLPLHEGWKFNYTGSDAQIVTKEIIREVSPVNGYSTIKHHVFRRYHIHITYHADNGKTPFTASMEQVEEVEATPENKCLRPFRDPRSVGHVLEWEDWHEWILGPTRGYLNGYIEYDAPLYVWYGRNEQGEESLVTVRDIVKWPDDVLADVEAAFIAYCSPSGPVIVCGSGGSIRVQNVRFTDWVNAKRGYYLRVESGPVGGIHADLRQSPEDYTVFYELVEGRIDTVSYGVNSWRADANSGGYMNLGFPAGSLNCAGELAELPPSMAGGWWIDVQGEYGTYETLSHQYNGNIRFGHTLIFPYNSGDSVYIQRDEVTSGYKHYYYRYAEMNGFYWEGTAVFADGHTAYYKETLRYWMNMTYSVVFAEYYHPTYHDPQFSIEYPEGLFYASYSGQWIENQDRRKLYYASAKNSDLVFDEIATVVGEKRYVNPHFFPSAQWDFPAKGIDTALCFGKHAWYVEISLTEFWPWFDFLVALNESYHGDAFYLQQWGPFEDHAIMPYAPIYNTTDARYPIFSSTDGLPAADNRQFHAVFTGWA